MPETRWTKDTPGQPPRIITAPREDEELNGEGWAVEALVQPLSHITGVLVELAERFPLHPSDARPVRETLREKLQRRANERGWGLADLVQADPDKRPTQGGVPIERITSTGPTSTPDAPTFKVDDILRSVHTPSCAQVLAVIDDGRLRMKWGADCHGTYRASGFRLATPEERATFLAAQTPEKPKPFEVGDIVVLKCDAGQTPLPIAKIQSGGIMRVGQPTFVFADSYRHATPEERAAYEASHA